MLQILIVEDDDRVANALVAFLGQAGYSTIRAQDGQGALDALSADVDVILLDLGLPDCDGFDLCRRIRYRTSAPIIMATARAHIGAKVHGLRVGADDYLVKPYDVRELIARIAVVTRRQRTSLGWLQEGSAAVSVGEVHIDLVARQVLVGDSLISLTPKEYDIVALLASFPGVTLPRERIVREVWQTSVHGLGHSLEVHVAAIRRKLGVSGVIETVRGVGYRLAVG